MYRVRLQMMPVSTDSSQAQALPEASGAAPKVIYIAGMTRSGTTLLDTVLNELPGFVGVGELRSYWRAMRERGTCACGAAVSECPFWGEVRSWIERRHGPLPVERAWFLQLAHVRSLPLQLARLARAGEASASPGAEYAELMARLYSGIAAASDAGVVVDSSKGPHDAYAISKFTDLDLFVIHLVRDPRAVAYSWSRKAWNPDKPTGYFERRRASEVALRWVARNALTEGLLARRLGPRYVRIRYEDFVLDPDATIRRIQSLSGMPRSEPVQLDRGAPQPNHSVSGNPARLSRGPLRIRPDHEWRRLMGRRPMLAATVGSAPLLHRYGYPLVPKR